MGDKDLTEKILEDYNDVFADIINVLLFNGQQKVKPTSLENSAVHSQYKAEDNKLHEQERDVSKTCILQSLTYFSKPSGIFISSFSDCG